MRALFVVALFAAPAFAQPAGANLTPSQAIDKVEATYAAAKGVTARLEQTVDNSTFGDKKTSTASIAEDHGKFAADYTNKKDKLDKSYLYDGKTFWFVEHLGLKATQGAGGNQALPVVLNILAGQKGAVAKQFTIAAAATSSLVPGAVVLTLTPKAASAAYKTVDIVIDPTNYTLARAIVVDSQDNKTTYEFSKQDLTAKIDASKFTFDPKQFPTYAIQSVAAHTPPQAVAPIKTVAKPKGK